MCSLLSTCWAERSMFNYKYMTTRTYDSLKIGNYKNKVLLNKAWTPHIHLHFTFCIFGLSTWNWCNWQRTVIHHQQHRPAEPTGQQGCWEPLQHVTASRVILSLAKRRSGLTWWHPIDLHSSVNTPFPWISICVCSLFFNKRRRKGSGSAYWWQVVWWPLWQALTTLGISWLNTVSEWGLGVFIKH